LYAYKDTILKQSSCKWNIELDTKLQKCGYKPLKLDPCTYVHHNGKELIIITVWVDDLLMFATSDHIMETAKDHIWSEWETTDLGELIKIVGIEITL
jgi:hypothetical protein